MLARNVCRDYTSSRAAKFLSYLAIFGFGCTIHPLATGIQADVQSNRRRRSDRQ